MTAKFYKVLDDNNVVYKTLELTRDNVTITQYLDTSIINPVFKCKTIPQDTNYLYCSDLERYYYIDDFVYSNQCIMIYCTIDVLYTYRNDIVNTTQVVTRQENIYDNSVIDVLQPLSTKTQTEVKRFGESVMSTENYILGVI